MEAGTQLRRGQLVLVAAAPGIGKSAFALTYALQSGASTFYQSCDSDNWTQSVRAISILTGVSLESANKLRESGKLSAIKGMPIRFNFKASPTIDDMELSVKAYAEVYGDYPELIIVDNITNVRSEFDNGDPLASGSLEALLEYLNTMSRDTRACVVGLHHVTGPYNDGDVPIPLSGIRGQVGRVPATVLTLHRIQGDLWTPDTLCVSTVKQRAGKSDPSGKSFIELEFVGDRMSIKDPSRGNRDVPRTDSGSDGRSTTTSSAR